MGHGGGAQPRLIGEYPSGHPVPQGGGEGVAAPASQGGLRVQGAGEDEGKGPGQLLRPDDQHQGAASQVQQGHGGHQPLRHPGHPAHASHHDQPGQQGCPRPHQQSVPAEGGLEGGGDGARLDQVAPRQGGGEAGQGEPGGQPGGVEAVPQVEHGAALPPAAGGGGLILHRQQFFHTPCGHSQQGGHPHPEHRPRPSQVDGHGHPGDAARADGGGQGGGQGLEGGDAAAFGGAAGVEQAPCGHPPPQPEAPQGKEPAPHCQYQTGEQKEPQQPGVPQRVGQPSQERHKTPPPKQERRGPPAGGPRLFQLMRGGGEVVLISALHPVGDLVN